MWINSNKNPNQDTILKKKKNLYCFFFNSIYRETCSFVTVKEILIRFTILNCVNSLALYWIIRSHECEGAIEVFLPCISFCITRLAE